MTPEQAQDTLLAAVSIMEKVGHLAPEAAVTLREALAALAAERARADELQDAAHWLTNERERLQLELQDATQERDQLREQRDAAVGALRDFADHGLRADLTPTCGPNHEPPGGWYGYLRRIDTSVRERARAIFQAADQRGRNRNRPARCLNCNLDRSGGPDSCACSEEEQEYWDQIAADQRGGEAGE